MGITGSSFRATKNSIGLGNVTNDAQVKKISSATDEAIVRFDGADGATIQNSLVGIDDTGAMIHKQIATPTTPDASYNKLYFKSDNNLYKLNSSGVETELTSGKISTIGTSTDNAVVRWDGTTGSVIQNSSLLVDDVGAIIGSQIATPTNPSASTNKLYFKSDDKLYKLTSGGIESEVGGGSGVDNYTVKASSGDASPNYLDGKVAKSIVVTSNKLELSGDSASPGNNKAYGTNHAGTLGYYDNNVNDIKRQAIIDGNFQIAQNKGVVASTFTNPTSGTYPIFDMWKVEYNLGGGTLPSNIIHSQQQITVGTLADAYYCYRVNPDGAGSGFGSTSYYRLSNYIFNGTRNLAGTGNTVTFRISALHTISGVKKLGVRLVQNYGTGGSPTADEIITGTNFTVNASGTTYAETIFTFTLNTIVGKTFGTNNDDYLKIELYYMWGSDYNTSLGGASAETFVGSGYIHIARVQLNAGSIALPFLVKSFEKELRDCCQWFKKSLPYATACADATATSGMRLKTYETSSYHNMGIIDFSSSPMARTPVIGFYNPQSANPDKVRNYTDNSNHPVTGGNVGTHGFYAEINNSSIAAAKLLVTIWTADSRF